MSSPPSALKRAARQFSLSIGLGVLAYIVGALFAAKLAMLADSLELGPDHPVLGYFIFFFPVLVVVPAVALVAGFFVRASPWVVAVCMAGICDVFSIVPNVVSFGADFVFAPDSLVWLVASNVLSIILSGFAFSWGMQRMDAAEAQENEAAKQRALASSPPAASQPPAVPTPPAQAPEQRQG